MRFLITIGLALLVGEACSQYSSQLPFGARLPGYERIQYAYGYQIPEEENPRRTHTFNVPTKLQVTNTPTIIKSPTRKRTEITSASPAPLDVKTTNEQLSLPPGTGYSPPSKNSFPPQLPSGSYHLANQDTTKFLRSPLSPPVNIYLLPNPDPVLRPPEPKTDPLHPLSTEYLPPSLVQRIPENPLTLTLEPLPSSHISIEPHAAAIKENTEMVQVPAQELPLHPSGVVGKNAESVLHLNAKVTPTSPYNETGEQEEATTQLIANVTVAPTFGVTEEHKDQPVKFSAETPSKPSFGVIEESKHLHVKVSVKTPDSCPDMFIPVTLIGNDQDQYSCIPIWVLTGGREPTIPQDMVLTDHQHFPPVANRHQNFGPIPFPALGILNERGVSQGTITARFPPRVSVQRNDNVCEPTPCGPNTRCKIHDKGFAQCTCLEDFIPDRNTIIGCKPQCVSDDDCHNSFRCQRTKCVRVCVEGTCGINAKCHTRNHRAVCQCPENFNGNPNVHCHKIQVRQVVADPCTPSPCGINADCQVRQDRRGDQRPLCTCPSGYVGDPTTHCRRGDCIEANDCPSHLTCQRFHCVDPCLGFCGTGAECNVRNRQPVCSCPSGFSGDPYSRCIRLPPADPCLPSPCGINADCHVRRDRRGDQRPLCSCPKGYVGDPSTNCRRGDCIEANDCPSHLTCQKFHCVDPCLGFCGTGAECNARNRQPVCSCPSGFSGDPYSRCTRLPPDYQCKPSPCGPNTNCRVRNDLAVCACIDNYIGNPYSGCRPECVTGRECPHNMGCRNNICVNPCLDACGEGAQCDVRNGRAICSCPQYYQGDPYTRCYAECTAHDHCLSYKACVKLQCVDPCKGACGTGANCKVKDHTPICSCPKGYTGHPYHSCTPRPVTRDDLCEPNPCGFQAKCVKGFDRSGNDRPVCSCPTGYNGNPLVSCQRGECQGHEDCPSHQACYSYTCQNPCYTQERNRAFSKYDSVCGYNAECTVKNHQPVCNCPPGYKGNPLLECYVDNRRRSISYRTGKKK